MFKKAEITQLKYNLWRLHVWYSVFSSHADVTVHADNPVSLHKILHDIIGEEK